MKILVPLGSGSNWQNNELRYMLRSIEQNLKGDYEIEIYGDAPNWVTNVKVVKTERYYPEWLREKKQKEKKGLDYENFFDTLNKVKMFAKANEGKFLYMYDDVLVIREININYIRNIPLEIELPIYYHIRKHEKHGRTINSSVDVLNNENSFFSPRDIYNYETHIPRVYECEKMRQCFAMFDFTKMEIPYALATVYCNYYDEDSYRYTDGIKSIKAGFYGINENVASYLSSSLEYIEAATKDKIFVNYNDMGLNCMATDLSGKQYLKEWIMNRFPNKSKFEK